MDNESHDDLLEDLESLTELHKQFMSPVEYISSLLAYILTLSYSCGLPVELVENLLKETCKEAFKIYKEGKENAD